MAPVHEHAQPRRRGGHFAGALAESLLLFVWEMVPLVMTNIAIEDGHRNSVFSH